MTESQKCEVCRGPLVVLKRDGDWVTYRCDACKLVKTIHHNWRPRGEQSESWTVDIFVKWTHFPPEEEEIARAEQFLLQLPRHFTANWDTQNLILLHEWRVTNYAFPIPQAKRFIEQAESFGLNVRTQDHFRHGSKSETKQ